MSGSSLNSSRGFVVDSDEKGDGDCVEDETRMAEQQQCTRQGVIDTRTSSAGGSLCAWGESGVVV